MRGTPGVSQCTKGNAYLLKVIRAVHVGIDRIYLSLKMVDGGRGQGNTGGKHRRA